MSGRKRINSGLFVFAVAFWLHLNGAVAGECIFPTTPGSVEYPPGWFEGPHILVSNTTIEREKHVDVWLETGKWVCPPYSWSLKGQDFHFYNPDGPEEGTTLSPFEKIQLWAGNSACGSCEIEVLDSRGRTSKGHVMCEAGRWVMIAKGGALPGVPCHCVCGSVCKGIGNEVWLASGHGFGIKNNEKWKLKTDYLCAYPYDKDTSSWTQDPMYHPPCGTPYKCRELWPPWEGQCSGHGCHCWFYGGWEYYQWGCE